MPVGGRARRSLAPTTRTAGRRRIAEAIAVTLFFALIVLAFSQRTQIQFTLPKLLWFFYGAAAIFALFAWRCMDGAVKAIPNIVLVPALLLLTWWGITTLSAADWHTALNGMHGRYNGLRTHTLMIGLFLAFASADLAARDIRALVIIMIAVMLPVAGYGAAQELGYDWFVWPNPRPGSTFGHPVPLAATIGLLVPFVVSFLLTAPASLERWSWAAVLGLLLFATAATLSRGPWVGVVAALLIVIAAAHHRGVVDLRSPAARWIAALIVALLIIPVNSEVLSRFSLRVRQLARLNDDPSFSSRFVFFDAAYRMTRDHPITGVGLENFGVLYPQYRPQEPEHVPADSIPTMAHSGYVQAAATTGLPGLALYLVMIGGVMFLIVGPLVVARPVDPDSAAMSDADWMLGVSFAAGLAGYLVQDASGWEELALSVYFWTLAGAGVSWATAGRVPQVRMQPDATRVVMALAVAVSVVAISMGVQARRAINLDRLFYAAQRLDPSLDWTRIRESVALGLTEAGDDAHYLDAAGLLYLRRVAAAGERAAFDRAAELFDRARNASRFDPYILIHRLDLETTALRQNVLKSPTGEGAHVMQSMLALDPNNATVHEAAARYLSASGRPPEARVAIERAIALRPSHPRFHEVLGDVLRAQHDPAKAVEAYRDECARAAAGSSGWISAKRKLMVTLAESGRNAEVIDEARGVIAQEADDDLAYTLMGLAHQSLREFGPANAAFAEALKINPGNAIARQAMASDRESR